jgi:outer membrane protein assembly factor BamD (BamD/ComL family)
MSCLAIRSAALVLTFATASALAQTLPPPSKRDLQHANVGTIIRNSDLFVAPNTESSKIQTVTQGHEVAITETAANGWVRVFANTDIEQNPDELSIFGMDAAAVPASGWILDKGVIRKGQANGDRILFGAAISAESDATAGHGRKQSAEDARLLYKRLAEYFPDSPLAAEAAWRSADIRWQLERQDSQSRPSAHEKENYLRGQMSEDEMHKIEKKYPHSKWSDLAAWDMLENKVCGDWQGSVKCPLKEAELYEKYVTEHPDSPRAAQALYEAAWRMAAAGDMYQGEDNKKKAEEARAQSTTLGKQVQSRFPQSDYADRAATLVYKVEQAIPIYGSDRD